MIPSQLLLFVMYTARTGLGKKIRLDVFIDVVPVRLVRLGHVLYYNGNAAHCQREIVTSGGVRRRTSDLGLANIF